jgi:hypothetical protein
MSRHRKVPTLVLGGTGYVAGEVLRLVLGHPQLELAGVMSDSQPGEPVGKAFPHLAAVLGDTTLQVHRRDRAARRDAAAQRRVLGGTAWRQCRADRPPAHEAAEAAGTKPASSTSRPTTATRPAGLRGGLQARARRAGAAVGVHLRRARAPGQAPTRTWRTPAASRPRSLLAVGAAAEAGARTPDAVRLRRHRQHRLGPQARRRHAPSAAPQRPVFLQRARAPAHAPEVTACAAGRQRRRRPTSRSCRTPGPFARGIHVTVQATLAQPADTADAAREAARVLRALAVRARARRAAARQGHRRSNYAHLSAQPTAAPSP